MENRFKLGLATLFCTLSLVACNDSDQPGSDPRNPNTPLSETPAGGDGFGNPPTWSGGPVKPIESKANDPKELKDPNKKPPETIVPPKLVTKPEAKKGPKTANELYLTAISIRTKMESDFDGNKKEITENFNDLTPAEISQVITDLDSSIGCHATLIKLWDLNIPKLDLILAAYWKDVELKPDYEPPTVNLGWKYNCYFTSDFIASHAFSKVNYEYNSNFSETDARNLSKSTTLQSLKFSNSSINDKALIEIGKISSLTHLNLSSTSVSDAGVKALAHLTNLQSLNLNKTSTTNEGVLSVGSLVELTDLNVGHMVGDVEDTGVAVISTLPKLHTLNLASAKLSLAGIQSLGKISTLRKLDLSYVIKSISTMNFLGLFTEKPSISPKDFVDEVMKLTQVTHLSLSGNKLEAAQGIVLASSTHLIELALYNNLLSLDFSGTKTPVVAAFAANKTIQSLSLGHNKFKKDELLDLKNNTTLTSLSISKSEVDDATGAALKNALPFIYVADN